MDHHLLSFVGKRPGAVACGVSTWVKWCRTRGEVPASVRLIDTRDATVERHADALDAWMRTAHADVDFQIDRAESFETGRGAWPAARLWRLEKSRADTDKAHFLLGPGVKSMALSIVSELPPALSTWYPAGLRTLVSSPNGDRTTLETASIGLEALLDLTARRDLAIDARTDEGDGLLHKLENAGIVAGDGVSLWSAGSLVADLAFERYGQLFAVRRLEPGHTDVLVVARECLERLKQVSKGLLVRWLVVSRDQQLRARLSGARHQGLYVAAPGEHRMVPPNVVTEWRAARLQAVPETAPIEPETSPIPLVPNALLVALGVDPSPTLNALATTDAETVYVAYDATLEATRRIRERLTAQLQWNGLPDVGIQQKQLVWLSSDAYGGGDLQRIRPPGSAETAPTVDVTPGTVAQGFQLARVPGAILRSQHLPPKSVDTPGVHALLQPATGAASAQRDPELKGASVLLQASVVGGTLQRGFLAITQLQTFDRFYATFARALDAHIATAPRNWSIPHMWPNGPLFDRFRELPQVPRPHGWHDGTRMFEQLVAWQLIQHGFEDVVCGLRWDETTEALPPRPRQTHSCTDEIDVVGRIGTYFLAIEVKGGRGWSLHRTATTHKARAEKCLGRFALSLVVEIPRSSDSLRRDDGGLACPVITWNLLRNREMLVSVLDEVVAERRGPAGAGE